MTINRAAIQAGFSALNQIGRQAARPAAATNAGGRSPSGVNAVLKTIVNRSTWLVKGRNDRPLSPEQRIGRMRDDIDRRSRELHAVGEKLIRCRGELLLRREQSPEMQRLARLARAIDVLQEPARLNLPDAPRVLSAVILQGEDGPTLEAHSPEVGDTATCVFAFDVENTLTRMGVSCSDLPGTMLDAGARQVDAQALSARVSAARMNQLGEPRGNEWSRVTRITRLEDTYRIKAAALEQAKEALWMEIEPAVPSGASSSGSGPVQMTEL